MENLILLAGERQERKNRFRTTMTHKRIKDAVTRRPFRPFTIHVDDGRSIEIRSDDEVVLHPKTKKTMILFIDEGVQIIDIGHISALQEV